jgi:hypothetical protein
MGLYYWVQTGFQSVSVAQDLIEIVAPSDAAIRVHEINVSQSSDTDSEQLQFAVIRAHSTSGSGGGSATVTPLVSGAPAAGGTYERNNTTQATGGSPVAVYSEAANVLNGLQKVFDPQIEVAPSVRLVLTVTAPGDAVTMAANMLVEEVGG